MADYELLYISDPNLTDDKRQTLEDRIQRHIETGGGNIDSVDDWGVRRLAYPIKKLEEGRYKLVNFACESEYLNTLEKQLRLVQGMIRFILVRKDK